jgi:hypothetical protein
MARAQALLGGRVERIQQVMYQNSRKFNFVQKKLLKKFNFVQDFSTAQRVRSCPCLVRPFLAMWQDLKKYIKFR